MAWEIVVGLETHTQLSTASKLFSGASTAFGAAANSQASAVDVALPGTLPVLNKAVVECAIKLGIAIGAKIASRSVFARKNYFYPDLPKGYQISQYELPIVQNGSLTINVNGEDKIVRILRAHLEEDAGKSIHGEALSGVVGRGVVGSMRVGKPISNEFRDLSKLSGIDLNRAGTPLLEIVSEPDMRGSKEAVAYAKKLHSLVRWIGICDGNMQEGSFRCDANVSVRKPGEPLGTRCEIKNLNSFRFMEQAIEYEAKRQIELIEDGGKVIQETRLYDPDRNETRPMRSKEDAQDYRYFPDPDLLPLVVSESLIQEVREFLPELPEERKTRYTAELGLSQYDASILTSGREIGDYFESVVMNSLMDGEPFGDADFKLCANWVINEVSAKLNAENLPPWKFGVSDGTLGYILRKIRNGTISVKIAKELFSEFWEDARNVDYTRHGGHPQLVDELIESRGLKQMSDSIAIEKLVDEVLAANAKQVEDYRAGKGKAFNSLVGQVMKATRGKANPGQVNAILKKKLAG